MAYGIGSRGGAAGSPTGYDPRYGGIPNLPPYTTDTQKTVGTDVQSEMIKNLPGYQNMVGADVGNIQSNLAGRLSPDVISILQQQAAERGVQTGAPGSPNTDAAYLRALGLTSLQLQQLGHSQLTEAMQRTPIQQTQTGTMTRDLGAERAVYASAPVPSAAHDQAIRDAQAGMGYGGKKVGGVSVAGPAPYNAPQLSPTSAVGAMGYRNPPALYGGQSGVSPYPGMVWDPTTGSYVPDPNKYTNWAAGMTVGGTGYTGQGTYYAGAANPDIQLYDDAPAGMMREIGPTFEEAVDPGYGYDVPVDWYS